MKEIVFRLLVSSHFSWIHFWCRGYKLLLLLKRKLGCLVRTRCQRGWLVFFISSKIKFTDLRTFNFRNIINNFLQVLYSFLVVWLKCWLSKIDTRKLLITRDHLNFTILFMIKVDFSHLRIKILDQIIKVTWPLRLIINLFKFFEVLNIYPWCLSVCIAKNKSTVGS